jgi:DNA polymerase I/DNA polymerase-2
MQFCLLDASYEVKDKPVIWLFGVDEKGKSVLLLDDYQPYFYVLPKNKKAVIEKLKKNKMVLNIETVRRIGLEEKEYLKVFVDLPQNASYVRDSIKHSKDVIECYEYNITFYKKYLRDKKFYPFDWFEVEGEEVKLNKEEEKSAFRFNKIIRAKKIEKIKKELPELRVLAFDIEVVDNKIIMISLAGSGFEKVLTYKPAKKKYVEILKNEKEMLERFEQIVNERDPDIIVGYNSDMFDFEIIRERCNEHRLDMKINRDSSALRSVRRARISATRLKGRLHIDLFNFVKNIIAPQLQGEILSLAEVSKELIGETKEELSLEDIIDKWKSGRIDDLTEYCMKDSKLTIKLAELLLPQIFELSIVSGQLPFDSSRLTYGLLVEWFLTRKATELDMIVPNTPHWDEIQKRRMMKPYEGGYVKEPKQGLHDDITVFDFRSLYPSIIVTFNISPETLNCKCCKNNSYKVPGLPYHFCKKKEGFIPRQVKQLIEKRQEIKNKMLSSKEDVESLNEQQKAVKIVTNATYGYLAYPGSRWYSRECSESAAAFGRYYIKETIAKAEGFGFDVLYGDTDSLFVKLKKRNKIETKAEEFLKTINKSLPGILELELQGIYEKGLFVPQRLGAYVAKKRYALIDKKGSLIIRGLETVRRDWCNLARNLQHDVIRLVLSGREKEAVEEVRTTVEKIKKRKIDLRDIAITTQLGKSLEEYKATAPHIAVARKLEKEGHEVREGMFLSFIITNREGSISEKAEPTDKVGLSDYDIDYYLNNQLIPVALRVLQVLGYKEADFKEDSLKKFVKK